MTINDVDPACWSWPIPDMTKVAEPWGVLADWTDDRCGSCGSRGPGVVDHDHQTGYIRGPLCLICNNAEGTDSAPRSRYARWRACPATAVLGFLLPYPYSRGGPAGDFENWTMRTYLPDHAPDPHQWPHALTCDQSPMEVIEMPGLRYVCGHDHIGAIARAILAPTADGEEPDFVIPEPGHTRLARARRAGRALADIYGEARGE